jgi:hypothetical protein
MEDKYVNAHDAPPHQQQQVNLKIPPFWASNPEAWFGMVEGQFILCNIMQDNIRFYYVLGALPESAVCGQGDLMRGPPPLDAYQQLKTRLLAAHTLTKFQRMDKLLSAQPLGGQKPSDLLHELEQFCPEGESQSKIFRYLFLQRLPAELRIILSEDSDSTLPVLAARADQLWAHSARRPHDAAAVNAVAEDGGQEETTVAAVAGQSFLQGGGRGKPRGGRGGVARGSRGGNAAVGSGSERTRALPPGWPSRPPGCADTTGGTAIRYLTAASPAHGRETGSLGRLNVVVPSSLVHIIDQLPRRRYLVDTGASFSIFPHKSTTPPTGQKLTGPDGQMISCWGKKRIVLVFHGRHFAWTFLLADVQFPIIGVDFLRQNRLLVDPVANRLVDTLSFESFPTVTELSRAVAAAGGPAAAGVCAALAPVFKLVLDQFPEVVNPEKRLPPKTKHGVEHHIRVKEGPPISSKFR